MRLSLAPVADSHDLAVNQQVQTRTLLVCAAADEEPDVISFNRKGLAGESPDMRVAARDVFALPDVVRVDDRAPCPPTFPW